MNYTDNYNLLIPEGTDIVNPLVDTNPNFVSIDTQMKANQDAAIGTATEIKTGNVHALTRANGDGAVFRFTATSLFNSGDTFTVDGVAVTALLPSGEALAEGAYIIGSEVLCCLKATLLTVFVSSNQAANSARLNNQLPAFYLNSENSNFDGSDSYFTATNVSDALKELQNITILATSSNTGTMAQKLSSLYAVFNLLPSNIKAKTMLGIGSALYNCINYASGVYSRQTFSSTAYSHSYAASLSTGAYEVLDARPDGSQTYTDYSSDVNDSICRLYLI